MRWKITLGALSAAAALSSAATLSARYGLTAPPATAGYGLVEGTPDFKNAGALAFGPEGILFVGDSAGAAVFAIDVGAGTPSASADRVAVESIDQKIGALLGAPADQILINDMAVQAASQDIYFSVTRGRGADSRPALVRLRAGKLENVPLEKVRYSTVSLSDAPEPGVKTNWGAEVRSMSITDLAFVDGRVYVAGLSREQFASRLRSAVFPFQGNLTGTSVEVFHTSHNRYETNSPIETFLPLELGGKNTMLAGYGCAPVALFDRSELQSGKHVRGITVAELGGGNRPVDMIAVTKGSDRIVIIANSDRTLMRMNVSDLASAKAMTTGVKQAYEAAGVPYLSIAEVGVMQLDDLNSGFIVGVQRDIRSGALNITSFPKRML
jgi:hypothetical protein